MVAGVDLPIVLPWRYIIALAVLGGLLGLGLLWAGFRLYVGKPVLGGGAELFRAVGAVRRLVGRLRNIRRDGAPTSGESVGFADDAADEDERDSGHGPGVAAVGGAFEAGEPDDEMAPVAEDPDGGDSWGRRGREGDDDDEDGFLEDIPLRVAALGGFLALVFVVAMSIWYVMGAWPFGPWRGFTILGLPAYWTAFFFMIGLTLFGLPFYVYFITPVVRIGSGVIGYGLWIIAAFASGGTIFERGGDGRYHSYPMRQGEHGRAEMYKDGEWRIVHGKIENVSRLGWRPIAFTWEKNQDTLEEIRVTDLGEDPVEFMVNRGVPRRQAEAMREQILDDGELESHEREEFERDGDSAEPGSGPEPRDSGKPAVADGSGGDPFNSRLGPSPSQSPSPTGGPSGSKEPVPNASRSRDDGGDSGRGPPGGDSGVTGPEDGGPPEGYNILDYIGHAFHAFNPWPAGADEDHVLVDERKVKMKLEGSGGIRLVERAREQALVDTSKTTARNHIVTWGMVFLALIVGISVALFTVSPG